MTTRGIPAEHFRALAVTAHQAEMACAAVEAGPVPIRWAEAMVVAAVVLLVMCALVAGMVVL